MINPTKKIEITASLYLPQLTWNTSKYYYDDSYITTEGFKEMCVKKYCGKGYQFSLHPFEVVILQ